MTRPPHSLPWCWEELLPKESLLAWFKAKKKPRDLYRLDNISRPGVYKFIFPEEIDGSSRHTPCYIGQAGDLGIRLQYYFRARPLEERRDKHGDFVMEAESSVIGAIIRSEGEFSLEVLRLRSPISLAGVVVNNYSLDELFARGFLENLALLHAVQVEHLRPLNIGMPQGIKDFWWKAKAARQSNAEAPTEKMQSMD